MINYKKDILFKLNNINNYLDHLNKLKKSNQDINEMNEYLLGNFNCKINNKYKFIFPKKLYDYLEEEIKKNDYLTTDLDVLNMLLEYKRINKCHYQYNDLYELPEVITYILINKINFLLDYEAGALLKNTAKKKKTIINILDSTNSTNNYDIERIITNVSDTDILLEKNKEYSKLDSYSKNMYRKLISRNSLRMNISEYQYVVRLLNSKKNISDYLITKTKYNKLHNTILGLSILVGLIIFAVLILLEQNIFVSGIISILFIKLLFSTISEFINVDFIPSYNDNTTKTVCVYYEELKDHTNIDNIMSKIEELYLTNNKNIDYTLLVECTYCDHQIEPYDEEILEYGLEACKNLNKKYDCDSFKFVYRKRVEQGDIWCGYNRRCGAIEHFVKLIRHQLTELEEYNYFTGHSAFNQDYKYLIVIDKNTYNTNLNRLIGILSHPYNKIKIDGEDITGYGMFTIENKCYYGSSSFNNNGIIDIDIFTKYYVNKLPSNILFRNLLPCGSINNSSRELYNTESRFKDDISHIMWCIKDKNIISSIKYNFIFSFIIELLSLVLCIYLIVNNSYLALLLIIIGNIHEIPSTLSYKIYTLLKCIIDKKYRVNVVDKSKEYYFPNILLSIIILILYFILDLNILIIAPIIITVLIGFIYNLIKQKKY